MKINFGLMDTDRVIRIAASILILFSVMTAFMSTPQEDEFAVLADEGYYFTYALSVKEGGIGMIPLLLKNHFADEAVQAFPHPGRIGHVLLGAFWFLIFPDTFSSLALLSLLCYALFLFVSFVFSRKYFGETTAFLYTVLLSVHPLFLSSAHRVLPDSILNLFWTLSFWLFLDFLMEKKKASFLGFVAAFSISLTVKESSLILLPFFAAAFLVKKYVFHEKLNDHYLIGACLLPLAIAGSLFLVFLGGWQNAFTLAKFILGIHFPHAVTNVYSLYGMGPWYKFIMDDMMMSPWTVLLAIGFFFHALAKIDKFPQPVVFLALFLVLVYAPIALLKFTKIIRFVMSLEIVVCLFAVLMLQEFCLNIKTSRHWAVMLLLGLVFYIYMQNYLSFVYLFQKNMIYDPISMWLLVARRIVPLVFY